MSNIIETIKAEMEAFNQKRKAMVEELRPKFPELFKPLFEANPNVKSVSWRQYTPYFNDGDECIFGVRNDYDDLDINGVDWYDREDNDETEPAYHQFAEILHSVPKDFYKDLFGDHVEVSVNADGTIDLQEYNHD